MTERDSKANQTTGRLRAHLIKGAAGSFVLQIGFAGFAFLNAIILARVLGPKGYGTFANAMAWVSVLTIPATFGFGVLLVRNVAAYRSQEKWALLKGLLHYSNRFVLLFSVLLTFTATATAWFVFSAPAQAPLRLTLLIAMPLVPLFALYNLRKSAIRGLEYVIRAQLPGMIVRPGLLLAGISLIYFFRPQHLSASTAMAVNVGATAVTLAMGTYWLRRLLPAKVKEAIAEYAPRPWLKAAFPMLVYGGIQIVLGQTDIIMLGAMRGAKDVGLYAAASRLAYLLVYVIYATETILAPVISRIYANGDKSLLQKIMTRAVRISFCAVFPFSLAFIFEGEHILRIFGPQFTDAKIALMILASGRLIEVGLGSSALILSMVGSERIVAITFSIISLINIALNALLIPIYGFAGAAIASIVSLVTAKCVLSCYAQNKIKINTTIWGFSHMTSPK